MTEKYMFENGTEFKTRNEGATMSKMQEAAEKKYGMVWGMIPIGIREDFEAGYTAAIADVKAGGIIAYEGQHTNEAPLYKLPEDV